MTVEEIVNLAVKWGPTAIMLLIILWSTFIGSRRGLRKSTILFVHAIIAGSIAVVFLIFASRSETADKLILEIANMILGSDTGLQDMLGASADCSTLREALIDGLPNMLSANEQLTIIIQANSSYILTIVELIASLVFSIVAMVLYFVLIFILYIVYLIFYSDKKYRKKLDYKIIYGKVEHTYKKRRLGGALVGALRGMMVALLFLSSLGSLLFIVTGGTGEKEMDDIEFGDSTIDMVYDIYSGVSEYGNHGIYKVLNIFKDNENTPFYLYAADIVFSARLDDEKTGIDETIIFREELGELVGFSKEIVQLLAKHYDGDIMELINSPDMDVIMTLLTEKEFQKDFDNLIDEFNTPQFASHFVFSLVETYLANLSDPAFASEMDPMITELLCILFKDGYLSESIPYEKQLYNEMISTKDYDNSKYHLDNLRLENIITKHNVKIIYKIITDVMSIENFNELSDEELVEVIDKIIDNVAELSLFNPDYNDIFNSIYRRLFAYIDAVLLNLGETEEVEYNLSESYYIDKDFDSVKWIDELNNLMNVVKDASTLFVNLKGSDGTITATALFSIYDKDSPNYLKNVRAFESLFDSISSSRILSMIFSSSIMIDSIEDVLESMIPGYQVPDHIQYYNTYNDNGTVSKYGELHYILRALKLMISDENINHVVLDLLYLDDYLTLESISSLLKALKKEDGILDTLLESRIMCSIFSTFITALSSEETGFEIYVHNTLYERDDDGNLTDLIQQNELKLFLYELVDVYDLISPLLEEEFDFSDISDLLSDPIILDVLESKIIEGTLSKLLINNAADIEFLVIPQSLLNGSDLISSYHNDSEIKTLIKVIQTTNIDFGTLLGESDEVVPLSTEETENPILDVIKGLSKEDITVLFDSSILHYTISNILETDIENIVGNFTVIIPETVKDKLVNDSIDYLIKKDVLVDFFVNVLNLLPEGDDFAVNDIITNLLVNMENYINNPIIAPTLVYYLLSSNEFESLPIPQILKQDGTYESLLIYRQNNLWRSELKSLLYSLDELFDISSGNEIIFDENTISEKLEYIIENYDEPSKQQGYSKLDLIYESLIISSNITKVLYEEILTEEAQLIKEELKYSPQVYDSSSKIIKVDEIKALVHSTNLLGIKLTEDELNVKQYITNISNLSQNQRDDLYDSYLLLGIITNAIETIISNSDGTLENTDLAYQNDYLIKTNEIDAILELLNNDLLTKLIDGTDQDALDFNDFNIRTLRNIIYDERTAQTKSYLILNSLSKIICDLQGIYIPKDDYQIIDTSTNKGFIKASSLATLIDGIESLGFDSVDIDFNNFVFPSAEVLEIISESNILRASITKMIQVNDDLGAIEIAVEDNDRYRIITEDYRNNTLIYVTKEEFKNMILGIEYIFDIDDTQVTGKDYKFKVDKTTLLNIAKLDQNQRDTIIKSCVLRYIVNKFFVQGIKFNLGFLGTITLNYEYLGIKVKDIVCYNLVTEKKFVTKFATEDQIHSILDKMNSLPK